jgi:hypothetical protein
VPGCRQPFIASDPQFDFLAQQTKHTVSAFTRALHSNIKQTKDDHVQIIVVVSFLFVVAKHASQRKPGFLNHSETSR